MVKQELDLEKKSTQELQQTKKDLEAAISALKRKADEDDAKRTELKTKLGKEIALQKTKVADEKMQFDTAMTNLRKASQASGLRVDVAVEFYHKAAFMNVAATDTAVQSDSFAKKVSAVREDFRLASLKGKSQDVRSYLKDGLDIFVDAFVAMGVATVEDFGVLARIKGWEAKFKTKAIELRNKGLAAKKSKSTDMDTTEDSKMNTETDAKDEDEFPSEIQMEKIRELVAKFDAQSNKVKAAKAAKRRTQKQYKESMEKMLGLIQNFGKLSGPQVEISMKQIRDTRDAGWLSARKHVLE